MSSATLGVHSSSKTKELMARVFPLSSAVVCIESIPAYAGVVVHGYYSWCMSGSLAGQLFSQVFFIIRGGGPGIIDVAMISNVFQARGTLFMHLVCSRVLRGDICCLWGSLCGQTPVTG